jgi:hypothetical protein
MRKRIKLSFLLLCISSLVFFSSSFYWLYREKSLKSAVEKKISEKESLNASISSLKEKIELSNLAIEENKISLKRLNDAEESLELFSEMNNFVAHFENIREEYGGINKASYEIREKENEITINLTFKEIYGNLRRFIYDLENQFYFLNISYLKMQKDGDLILGNMGINAYFRGDKDR